MALIWDATTGKLIHRLKHPTGVLNLAFSSDSRKLATVVAGGVNVWGVVTGNLLQSPKPSKGPGSSWRTSVAFSPDGRHLAIGSGADDYRRVGVRAVIWDLTTQKEVLFLDSEAYSVWDLVYTPDGNFVVGATGIYNGGSRNGEVKVWDANTGALVRTLRGFTHCVWSVAISPDGHRLAAASGRLDDATTPGVVKIWDLPTGNELASFNDFVGCVYSVDFSRSGKRLAVGCADGTIRILGE